MASRTQRQQTKSRFAEFAACVNDASAYLQNLGVGTPQIAPQTHSVRLDTLRQAMTHAKQPDFSEADFIEEYAQAMACGRIATRGMAGLKKTSRSQLAAVANPLIAKGLDDASAAWP